MDSSMYKQKKKRTVNPDIPRPNLFSHEKTLREQASNMSEILQRVDALTRKAESQTIKIQNLENTVSSLLRLLGK
jgi:hypothetical protein